VLSDLVYGTMSTNFYTGRSVTMVAWLKRIGGWIAIGLILAGAWWFLFRAHAKHESAASKEKELAPIPVTVLAAGHRAIERFVSVVGSLQGIDEIVLTPKVEGRVKTVLHEINDILKPDAPLLVIDETDCKLAES